MDNWSKRNLYPHKSTQKHDFSPSLWLSSSEGPCVLSEDGESENIPGSAGLEELYSYGLWFDEVSWTKNYVYNTADDQNTLSILLWLECEEYALDWKSVRLGLGTFLIHLATRPWTLHYTCMKWWIWITGFQIFWPWFSKRKKKITTQKITHTHIHTKLKVSSDSIYPY